MPPIRIPMSSRDLSTGVMGIQPSGITFPNVDEKTDDYWYRTFNLGLFYQEPGDYMAELAQNHSVGVGAGFLHTDVGGRDDGQDDDGR